MVLAPADGSRELTYTEPPVARDALHFEAAEVARCVAAAATSTRTPCKTA